MEGGTDMFANTFLEKNNTNELRGDPTVSIVWA